MLLDVKHLNHAGTADDLVPRYTYKLNLPGAFSLKGHFLKEHFLLQGLKSYSSSFISNRKRKHNGFWEMPLGPLMKGHH